VSRGTTVLLTTQYLEEADYLADNIVVIDHGTVIAEGSATQLKERLGATVVEITMRDDDSTVRAVELLAPVGKASRDGKLVRVNVPGGAGASSMLDAVRILDGAHLDPAAMVLREPTLDDVFLELTGHSTSDGDDGDGDGNQGGDE
jgi:ABC-type multidrug transport system ATPase subunit